MAEKTPARAPEIVTTGRIVHFVMPFGQHRPAIIVVAGQGGIEDSVELTIFQAAEDGPETCRQGHVPFDRDGKVPHSWHWPERDNGLKGFRESTEIVSGTPSTKVTE